MKETDPSWREVLGVDEELAARAQSRYPILKFFECGHLPEKLQDIVFPFGALAYGMAKRKPDGCAETAAGLRKLLEAKDCAVRAAL